MCRPMMYWWLTATSEVMVCFDSIKLVNPEFTCCLSSYWSRSVNHVFVILSTESEECQALSASLQTAYGKFLQVKGKVELSV